MATLPALASIVDLNSRLPAELSNVDDESRAQAALDDASALVRQEAGLTWVDALNVLTTVPDVVVTITLEVARRALNRSFVYGAENEDDRDRGLFLKASEKRILNSFTATTHAGLRVIDTTRGDDADLEFRLDSSAPYSDPIPWGYSGATPWFGS